MSKEIKTKICTKCGEEKPATREFFRFRNDTCRYRNECEDCAIEKRKLAWSESKLAGTTKKRNNKVWIGVVPDKIMCPTCKVFLPGTKDYFHCDKGAKYGFCWECKNCRNTRLGSPTNKEKKSQYYRKNELTILQQEKEYRAKNKKKIKERKRKYRERMKRENPEKIKEYRRTYREKNRARILAREKANTTPQYLLRKLVSGHVRHALKKSGSSKNGKSTFKYLPYTPQELKEHLESQFDSWMTWDNYGKFKYEEQTWQLDHIQPCASLPYDSMDHPNFLKCWSLSNLRPLDSRENASKGSLYEGERHTYSNS